MLKMGIYGIVRMSAVLPLPPVEWGEGLLAADCLTAVAGIVWAIGQHDLKRLLAYSSVENMGVIAIGIGLALCGRAEGKPAWILFGLGGALLHVWNHALFKSLMFFNAGAILHAVGTRGTNRMGGLSRQMPITAFLFLVGSLAISALPPFNGFVSEWLLYRGLFGAAGMAGQPGSVGVELATVALALVGTLAVLCFVRAVGILFLGHARTEEMQHAHDPGFPMLVAMIVPALLCLFLGLGSVVLLPTLETVVRSWAPEIVSTPFAGFPSGLLHYTLVFGAILTLAVVVGTLAVRILLASQRKISRSVTWDCGYANPTRRMQYTGSSFTQILVRQYEFLLRPERQSPTLKSAFPEAATFKSHAPDIVLERLVLPVFRISGAAFQRLRILQQGRVHLYLLYILLVLLLLLCWEKIGATL